MPAPLMQVMQVSLNLTLVFLPQQALGQSVRHLLQLHHRLLLPLLH